MVSFGDEDYLCGENAVIVWKARIGYIQYYPIIITIINL